MAIILYIHKVIWTCLGRPFFSGHGVYNSFRSRRASRFVLKL